MLHRYFLSAALGCATSTAAAASAVAGKPAAARLEHVASFAHQVTGVAVSPQGRIFVNFPRWTDDAPVSVAEVQKDGTIKPYPDAEWNAWRSAKPLSAADHFVCVQSVYADSRNQLWVLDPAAPQIRNLVAGGPKLVRIDLATDKVVQTIAMAASITPAGAYLNDIRLTPDGAWGFITDSGRGALVVVNLKTGQSRRVLDGHAALQADPAVTLQIDGQPLRFPDGKPMAAPSDGLAIDAAGQFVYWQALTGRTLYRLPVAALIDPQLPEADLAKRIETVQTTHPADGLWLTAAGELYVTAIETDAVTGGKVGGPRQQLVQDKRLRWPDSLAEGADGSLYVTASHIQDTAWFTKTPAANIDFSLWRVRLPR